MSGSASLDKIATAAERLLLDPAYTTATTALREELVKSLENAALDGSHEGEQHVLELVRMLQMGNRYQSLLSRMIDHGKLSDHELERKARYQSAGM